MVTFNLTMIAVLIFFSAFFVATEFAIVRIRSSRVDQLVLEKRTNALALQKVILHLDEYLSSCQLGITLTSLGLGWLGKPTVENLLLPVLGDFVPAQMVGVIAFIVAFSAITFLHVVVGELAPKTLAIQRAERISLLCSVPIIWFHRIFFPLIWLLNLSSNKIVGLFGINPASEHEEAHSEGELRIIMSESYASGQINQSEYGYVNRIFAFDDRLAHEVMVPRTDMICLDLTKPLEENIALMKEAQYTRFPVINGDKDNVTGIINTKQFFLQDRRGPLLDLTALMKPMLTISDHTPLQKVLKLMQQKQVHMAILVDEYGGTAGMITLEDILEEIVGEIRDEFDEGEKQEFESIGENRLIVDGKVSLHVLQEKLPLDFDHEDLDTLGGWIYHRNPTIRKGGWLDYQNYRFTVREKGRHRILRVEIAPSPPETPSSEGKSSE